MVGLAFGACGLLWSATATVILAPTFAKMFSDFGGKLPAFTELCLTQWFPLTLGLVPLAVVGAGIFGAATRKLRAILMSVAIFLTLALPVGFLIAMYLPIFSIAGAVK